MEKTSTGMPCIKVPIWLVTVIIAVAIPLIGFIVYQLQTQATILNTLESHAAAIKELKENIAPVYQVSSMQRQLDRIEDKVDRMIEQKLK